jgi:predicted nucleotidyltransferase
MAGAVLVPSIMTMGLQAEYVQLAEEYVRAVRDFFGNRLLSICFFGSIVRGNATPESDIDVLIVAESMPKDFGLRVRESSPIHETLRRSEKYRELRSQGRSAFVSEIFLTPGEAKSHPPILLDLTDEAFIVYDKNDFLKTVLAELKQNLKALGAKKVKARKGYYWVLKPDAKPSEVVKI